MAFLCHLIWCFPRNKILQGYYIPDAVSLYTSHPYCTRFRIRCFAPTILQFSYLLRIIELFQERFDIMAHPTLLDRCVSCSIASY